jgi:hypothetical protein
MSAHQNNHYVPASYFRPWCGDDKKLTYFHWVEQRFLIDRASPRAIASERNLYTLHGAPDDQAAVVETDFFARLIDQPGATIQQKILSGIASFSLEERHKWARYLMALRARTPEMIATAQKLGREGVRAILRDSQNEYEAIKPLGGPATFEECVAPWFLENFGTARVIPALIDKEETRSKIVAMDWWCQDFSGCGRELLTCDRPLVWQGGVDDKNFLLALPISPKLVFFIVNDPNLWANLARCPLRELAKQVNVSIISNAVEYVYAAGAGPANFIRSRLRRSETSVAIPDSLVNAAISPSPSVTP